MPDFGIAFDGAPLAPWLDPPTGELPSRINPTPTRPHLRRLATVGQEVELAAIVAGVTGPLDAALGGRVFVGWWIEHPTVEPPAVASPAGQSSIVRFTPALAGHYTYCLRRDGGGGLILHVDAL